MIISRCKCGAILITINSRRHSHVCSVCLSVQPIQLKTDRQKNLNMHMVQGASPAQLLRYWYDDCYVYVPHRREARIDTNTLGDENIRSAKEKSG